jgi:hypothetical protein
VTAKPTNHAPSDVFPAPAPPADPTPATALSEFDGTSPNGTWELYVVDDALGESGAISGGWCLTIDVQTAAPTTTSLQSDNNPSLIGEPVTFTATVSASGGPVTAGTVTFREGASVLAGPIAVDANGQAAFTTSALTLGSHVIAADYIGTDDFTNSTTMLTQVVEEPTIVADAGGPYTIAEGEDLPLDASATVADASATYSWDVNGDGTFGDATGVSPTLSWADLNALGIVDGPTMITDVAVQVTVGVTTRTSPTTTLTVANAAPTVAVGSSSGVAGTPVSVALTATDPSPADEAASFTYHIDWGDGSPAQDVVGLSSTSVTHTYASSGTYTVMATATDKDGAVSAPATGVVQVAPVTGVTVGADPCDSGGTALVVRTGSGDDNIRLEKVSSTTVRVLVNGVDEGVFSPTRIIVLAGDGDDSITVDGTIGIPRILAGEGGDDSITGGNGTDVQLGGAGDDVLNSGNGRDILIGGAGGDSLRAGHADDLLVAGSSTYEADSDANRQALCAIAAEWDSDADYTTRVDHLLGTVPGGLNGAHLLAPGVTVTDDGVADALTGDKGRDWFLLNITGGALDTSDASGSETTTDL